MVDANYINNFEMRLKMAEKHIRNLEQYELKTTLPDNLKQDCVFAYDNMKNDVDIFVELKEAVFALKELLDIIFAKIKRKENVKIDSNYKKIKDNISKIENEKCKLYLSDINNLRKIIFLRDLRNYLKYSSNITFFVRDFKFISVEVELKGDTISAIENKNIKSYKLFLQLPKFLANYVLFLKEFNKVCCE